MTRKTVSIPQLSCGHCVATIKRELDEVPGIVAVEADTPAKLVTFCWEPPASWEKIAATLTEIGYPAVE